MKIWWWAIASMALVGVMTAYFITSSQNAKIEETWQSTAPVLILKTSTESDTEYENRLRLAEGRARIAVDVDVAGSPGVYRIQASAERGRLEFIALDSNPAGAEQLAEGLRSTYLTAEPTDGIAEQLSRNLDDLEVQILALRSDRAALVATTPVDPGVAAQLALMDSQLSSLRQRAASLSLAIRFPELGTALDEEGNPRPASEVRAELARVQTTINRLQSDYDSLASVNPDSAGSDGSGSLDILVIDQQIRDLESQYVDAALTLEDLGGGGTSSVVSNRSETINVTPLPTPPTRAGAIGLVLGALLASAVIVAIDRIRRPVLGTEDDLPLLLLATVDSDRPRQGTDQPWYSDAQGRRRATVQALRASLDSVIAGGSTTIGFSGMGVSDWSVQEMVADLAVCFAAAGREVLLMDVIFDSPSGLPEYGNTGATVSDMVTSSSTARDETEDLMLALADRDRVVPELISVRAGSLDVDPVDAVAGRRFRGLLDVAVESAELVVVASPQWGSLVAEALVQQLDSVVLVGRLGATTAVDLEDAVRGLTACRATAVGLVMLRDRSLLASVSDHFGRST